MRSLNNEVGYAITSTDRPDCLSKMLESMRRFAPDFNSVYIFDDSSHYKSDNKKICDQFGYRFIDTGERIGISKNSNEAISYMYEKYPFFVLMNHDLKILRMGWEKFYYNAMRQTGLHHFCFRQYGLYGACRMGESLGKGRKSKPDIISEINGVKIATINDISNGVILTFDRTLVDKVGYFDEERFPNYGRGHNDFTNRVSMSGIQISGTHDVYGSNDYFKINDNNSVTPSTTRRKNFIIAKQRYDEVKEDRNRIYVSRNLHLINNEQNKKSISIILTAYKTQNYIEETLDSIENQTYFKNNDNYEILLGIDGCKDTLEKVKSIRSKYRNLRVFMMSKNVGTYITTNTMLSLCKGENIIRFDTDDVMKDNMVERVIHHLKNHEYIRFGFCDFYKTIKHTTPRGMKAFGVCAYRKSLIDKLGGYKAWSCSADADLYFRSKSVISCKLINEILFFRRRHDDSLTLNKKTCNGSVEREKYDVILNDKNNYVKSKCKIVPVISNCEELIDNKFNIIKNRPNIIYNIASFNREDSLGIVINDILPQCDFIRVYLNDYKEIPKFLDDSKIVVYTSQEYGECGDIGKFHDCNEYRDCYYFTIDDDIFYPNNYSNKMIDVIEKYGRDQVVGVHGVNIKRTPIIDYYKNREVYHFKKELKNDKVVDILGTGTVAYYSNNINISREFFKQKNMADIWFACYLQQNKVKRICIKRDDLWLKPIELECCQKTTIHDTGKREGWGTIQAKILNKEYING